MRGWFAIPLWKRVLGGLFLGLLLAIVWPQAAPNVAVFGDLFVRAIRMLVAPIVLVTIAAGITRSEEHTSELQSLMRISYAVFCLKKKKKTKQLKLYARPSRTKLHITTNTNKPLYITK